MKIKNASQHRFQLTEPRGFYFGHSFNTISNWGALISGLFLLFLAVGGNFIAETFGCHLQRLLTHSPGVKFLFLFMITYFATSFQVANTEPISAKFLKAIVVFFLFVLVSKTTIRYMGFTVLILMLIFLFQQQKGIESAQFETLEITQTDLEKRFKIYNTIQVSLFILLFFVLLLGVRKYARKQMLDRGAKEGAIGLPGFFGLDSLANEQGKAANDREWLWSTEKSDELIPSVPKNTYSEPILSSDILPVISLKNGGKNSPKQPQNI